MGDVFPTLKTKASFVKVPLSHEGGASVVMSMTVVSSLRWRLLGTVTAHCVSRRFWLLWEFCDGRHLRCTAGGVCEHLAAQ